MRKIALLLVGLAFLVCISACSAFNDTEAKACTEAAHKIAVVDNYVVEDIQVSSPTASGKTALIVVTPKTKAREDVKMAGWAGIAVFDVLQAKNPEVSASIISIRYFGDEYNMLITPEDLTQARADGKVESSELFDVLNALIYKNGVT